MKVCWATDFFSQGNAYGYSFLNKKLKEELGKHCEISNDADIAVSIKPADRWDAVPNKYNVLFTMWETDKLPQGFIDGIAKADEIIVPCKHNRDLIKPITWKKVSVCRLGVDTNLFKYKERTFIKGQKFRILWLGAPNPRKGYHVITEIIKVMEKFKDIEFYLKTTVPLVEYPDNLGEYERIAKEMSAEHYKRLQKIIGMEKPISVHGLYRELGVNKNIIWDSRDLNVHDLVELYNSAHCFVFPSFGEGWGLTLSEAMATGCPSIAPVHTGIEEFFSEDYGWECSFKMKEIELDNYNLKTKICVPDTDSVLSRILEIVNNYNRSIVRAKKGAEHIANKFTWEKTGKRLFELLKEIKVKNGSCN